MTSEPVLTYVFSDPLQFRCSFCGKGVDEGAFVVAGHVDDLLEAFRQHVKQYHPRGEDFSKS